MDAYVFQSALLCADCAADTMAEADAKPGLDELDKQTSDYYPQGPYPNGGGEADCPQHCDQCNLFLENPLTDDGEAYVRDVAADAGAVPQGPDDSWSEIAARVEKGGNPVVAEWIRFYFAWGQ